MSSKESRKVGIIPARMGSTRFPGKPLKEIHGTPMVGHVYYRSKYSTLLDEVVVATCNQEIKEYVESIGGRAIMTSDEHPRASDRAAEATLKIENSLGRELDLVVMIQGDEPMVRGEMIDKATRALIDDPSAVVANLMQKIDDENTFKDPNEIKVIVGESNKALYFSRSPIPSNYNRLESHLGWKQVCIIPFERDFLFKFNELAETPLEKNESVDMLRVLENNFAVKMVPIEDPMQSVDTPDELKKVESMMENDSLRSDYE